MTLGERIKKEREAKKLSQEELAEQIGVSRQAVSKWEGNLSVPTGSNKRALCEILSFDLDETERKPKKYPASYLFGWILALFFGGIFVWNYILNMAAGMDGADPALVSLHFYDKTQEEVFSEALWYNSAKIESILLQWTGGTPATVKMFFTPAGSETMEDTELLVTRSPDDGETALLISADPLHRDNLMGHLYFELDFGEGCVVAANDLYNIYYDPTM